MPCDIPLVAVCGSSTSSDRLQASLRPCAWGASGACAADLTANLPRARARLLAWAFSGSSWSVGAEACLGLPPGSGSPAGVWG